MYYNQLKTEEQTLVESKVANNSRSLVIAYLLLFFLGGFGVHHFYVERGFSKTGFAQLLLTVIGYLTLILIIGIIFLVIVCIWLIVDAVSLPGMINDEKDKMREIYAQEILAKNNIAGE